MKKKSLKPWIIMLVLPYVLLVVTSLVQFTARFVFTGAMDCGPAQSISEEPSLITNEAGEVCQPSSGGVAKAVINIFSFIVGLFSVFGILLTPLWIVMLVRASNYNKQLNPPTGTPPQVR